MALVDSNHLDLVFSEMTLDLDCKKDMILVVIMEQNHTLTMTC